MKAGKVPSGWPTPDQIRSMAVARVLGTDAALPVNTHHMVPEYHGRSADTPGVLRCEYCGATDVSTHQTCPEHPPIGART